MIKYTKNKAKIEFEQFILSGILPGVQDFNLKHFVHELKIEQNVL